MSAGAREKREGGAAKGDESIPLSVRGSATVTLTVQRSQQISSSPRTLYQALRRRFSKNCTAIWPRPLPLPLLGPGPGCCRCGWVRSTSSWRTSADVRWSIMVSSSASATYGSVKSRTSRVCGRMDGKKRWKKMVWRIPNGGGDGGRPP